MKKLLIGNWKDVSKSGTKLQAIKRLSDGVVFKLGDYVTNGTRMRGRIESFYTDDDVVNRKPGAPIEMGVVTDWSGIGMDLDSVMHTSAASVIMLTPSQFQVKDICVLRLGKESMGAQVTNVAFAEGKVFYDLDIAVEPGVVTRIHRVDSAFVHSINEPPSYLRYADPLMSRDEKPEPYVRKKKKK